MGDIADFLVGITDSVQTGGEIVGNFIESQLPGANYSFDEFKSGKDFSIDGDIINSYPWTPTPKTVQGKIGIPYISMDEYELQGSYFLQSIKYWLSQIANTESEDPYYGLYHGKSTGTTFRFPYYSSYHHIINNHWTTTTGLGGFINTFLQDPTVAAIGGLFVPQLGIEVPQAYQNADKAAYNFSFFLFNTFEVQDSEQQIKIDNNRKLIDRLIFATLQDKRTSITTYPPCIYTVSIPGIRYSPAAVINNLQVENVGHIGKDQKGMITPDAWKITISIQELITESRIIFDAASKSYGGDPKIRAIVDTPSDIVYDEVVDAVDFINETITEA